MRIGLIAAGVAAVAAIGAVPARADDASLYRGAGPRPGPDILYAPPADAPQLHNGSRRAGCAAAPTACGSR